MRVVFFFGLAIADYASSSSSSSRPMMTATSSVPEPSAEALAALKHAVASLQPGFLGAWATDLDFLLRARREVASGSFVHFEEALHPSKAEEIHAALWATPHFQLERDPWNVGLPPTHAEPLLSSVCSDTMQWLAGEGHPTVFQYHHHNIYNESKYPPEVVAANAFFDTPESRAIFGFIAGADNNNNNNNAVSGQGQGAASSSPCSPPANCSSSSSSLGKKESSDSHDDDNDDDDDDDDAGDESWASPLALLRMPLGGFTASWYRTGDHSTVHTDGTRGVTDTDGRRLAFILHLTKPAKASGQHQHQQGTEVEEKGWDGDAWGGNLVWCSPFRRIAPSMNSLTLFAPSGLSGHFVQAVRQPGDRYAAHNNKNTNNNNQKYAAVAGW